MACIMQVFDIFLGFAVDLFIELNSSEKIQDQHAHDITRQMFHKITHFRQKLHRFLK